MKRVVTCLTAIAFVAVMLVLPVLHRISGCDGAGKTSGPCAACKLSHMPIEGASEQVDCVDLPVLDYVRVAPPLESERAAPPRDARQPRAPPALG